MTTFGSNQLNHHEPGYIYLIEAIGYHGITSAIFKRCKIGLSRNPEARRQNFVNSQFPCDVKLIKTIFVEDMATVEEKLHKEFDFCNVELEKSREWFDLSPWQYWRVRLALITNEVHVFSFSELPWKAIGGTALATLLIGVIIGATVQNAIRSNRTTTPHQNTPFIL